MRRNPGTANQRVGTVPENSSRPVLNRRFRTGVIGLGRIGFSLGSDKLREQPASHARAFSQNKAFELDGGCDPDARRREDFLRAHPRARSYAHTGEMLTDLDWDLLVIATPEETHLEVFREVAQNPPRLVVLEKPVAANLADALEIERIATEKKIPVLVNHERRFSADWLWAQALAKSGELGELLLVNAAVLTRGNAWYEGDEKKARGALLHDATHLVDCVSMVSGASLSVESAVHTGLDEKKNIRGLSFSGKTGDGIGNTESAVFHLHAGYGSRAFVFEAEFLFRQGRIRIGNGVLSLERAVKSPFYENFQSLVLDRRVKPFRKTGYFSGMVQAAAEYLDGKTPLRSSLSDGIAAMRVLDRVASLSGN